MHTTLKKIKFYVSAKPWVKYTFLSILSGMLLAFSYGKFHVFVLAWIGFVPLVYCILKNKFHKSLLYGFIAGFVCSFVTVFWMFPFLINNIRHTGPSLGLSFFLWFYLALYFAVWAGAVNFISKYFKPLLTAVFAASVWVVLELAKTYFLTGFPLVLFGYTQSYFLPFIQIADIAGVYGVSFVLILINMLLFYVLAGSKQTRKTYVIVLTGVIFAVLLYGAVRIIQFSGEKGTKITVGVVQPDITQSQKWKKVSKNAIIRILETSSRTFEDKNIDLAVYPETVLPGYLTDEPVLQKLVESMSKYASLNLIGGMLTEDGKTYNSVFITDSEGEILDIYKKRKLVLFGEYIPFKNLSRGLMHNINRFGNLSKDDSAQVYTYNNIPLGIIICSENFYPGLSGDLVLNRAEILTNHTNDAWFLKSSALYQHYTMNIFRAVENRRYVIVSANTGISSVIDAKGKSLLKTKAAKREAFTQTAVLYKNITFYTKYRDIFVYLCAVFCLALLCIGLFRRIKRRKPVID